MTYSQWTAAINPKVCGTWNLHNALLNLQPKVSLDFFFLFSSGSAATGQWGQSNYAAANTFLDAFVQYRHSLGLPASVLDIGAIEDVGYVSQNIKVMETLRSTAQFMMRESELLDCIEVMLHRSWAEKQRQPSKSGIYKYVERSQLACGLRSTLPILAPGTRVSWRKDPRILVYRNIEAQPDTSSSLVAGGSSDTALKRYLRDLKGDIVLLNSEKVASTLATEIGKTLAGFLMISDEGGIDLNAPLAVIGIDSLISIELRNWMRRAIGVDFTAIEVARAESVGDLGVLAQEKLKKKYDSSA